MKSFKDYVLEIIDEDTVVLSKEVLSEYCQLEKDEVERLISGRDVKNIQLVCDRDADVDDDRYVDASSYFFNICGEYISHPEARDLWQDVRNLDEYIKRYESY